MPSEKKVKEKFKFQNFFFLARVAECVRAGRENIWLSIMSHGPRCVRSVRHDFELNIFPSHHNTDLVFDFGGTTGCVLWFPW